MLVGECDLTSLPRGMGSLKANNNYLSGEITLRNLPPGLERLDLRNNRFSGVCKIDHIPEGVSTILLQDNFIDSYEIQIGLELPNQIVIDFPKGLSVKRARSPEGTEKWIFTHEKKIYTFDEAIWTVRRRGGDLGITYRGLSDDEFYIDSDDSLIEFLV